MKKPDNWDKIKPRTAREELPEPGGYMCRIIDAHETKSKAGRDMLVLKLDIAEGKHAGFFQRRYDRRMQYAENIDAVKWPLISYTMLDGDYYEEDLKTLEVCLQAANRGYVFDFTARSMVGKRIGFALGHEYIDGNNGQFAVMRPCYMCTPEDVASGTIRPKDKYPTTQKAAAKVTPYGESESTFYSGAPFPTDDDCPF